MRRVIISGRMRGGSMKKKYDVAVIGGGPAAIFACWEFSEKFPGLSVVMLEEGHTVAKRHCPLAAGKTARVRRRRGFL